MASTLFGYAKKAAGVLLLELLVPGGTLIVLMLLFTGVELPIPERLAAALPALRLLRRA